MTSAAKTELQVGRLSPEDADRFAAMFRPAWELDDAPFASGTKLSAAEMDALAGGAGVNSEVTAHSAPRFPPARVDSKPPEASIVVAPDPVPAAAPRAPAPAVASAVPQAQQQRRSQRPAPAAPAPARAAAPPRNALDSGDFTPPKKSNTGIIIGVALVGLLAVGGIIAKFAIGGDAPKANPVSTQPTQTTEERHIPPPPTDLDTPPNPTTTAAATTAAATSDKPTPPPTATATATPTAIPTQTATAAATARPTATAATTATARPTATAATTTRPARTGTGKTNTGKGTGGIVRDTPF